MSNIKVYDENEDASVQHGGGGGGRTKSSEQRLLTPRRDISNQQTSKDKNENKLLHLKVFVSL